MEKYFDDIYTGKKKKIEKLCIGVDFGDGLVFNQ